MAPLPLRSGASGRSRNISSSSASDRLGILANSVGDLNAQQRREGSNDTASSSFAPSDNVPMLPHQAAEQQQQRSISESRSSRSSGGYSGIAYRDSSAAEAEAEDSTLPSATYEILKGEEGVLSDSSHSSEPHAALETVSDGKACIVKCEGKSAEEIEIALQGLEGEFEHFFVHRLLELP